MQFVTTYDAGLIEEMWAMCQQAGALREQRYGQGRHWQILRHWQLIQQKEVLVRFVARFVARWGYVRLVFWRHLNKPNLCKGVLVNEHTIEKKSIGKS